MPDTFGVNVHVTDGRLKLVVDVPSEIDSGWQDREEFQKRIEEVIWNHLDREATLGAIARDTPAGETARLGTVTLSPDGTVHDHALSAP